MAITSIQIADAIRRKLLEQSADIVTDSVLYMNMNLAYDDIRFNTFSNDQIKSATVSIVNGAGTLPSDFGTLYGPGYKTTTDKLPFEEKSIADFYRDQTIEGMTVAEGVLKVSPSSTSSLMIKYFPSYTALSSSQNPQINPYLNELIIYGGLYRIHEDMQNESLAEYYKTEFKNQFKEKTSALSNYQEDNADGGQMFNHIRII